jgi:hypothetical protein
VIFPPAIAKPLVDLITMVGERAVVALIEAAVNRTKAAQLKRNKTFFQRLFSRKAPP